MSLSFVFDGYGNRKYLDQSERRAFLAAADTASPEVKTFCMVLAYTGARISEVLALSPSRIDFKACVIVFESLKKRRRGHYRAVPVPRKVLVALDAVHGVKKAQESVSGPKEVLWPWCRTTAWTRVKEVMEKAGIAGTHASPKGLRHSLGVSALQSGVPLNILQKWLGHTHLRTTAIYADAIGPEEREMAGRFWEAF